MTMNIAAECDRCCADPGTVFAGKFREVSKYKSGYAEFCESSGPPRIYRQNSIYDDPNYDSDYDVLCETVDCTTQLFATGTGGCDAKKTVQVVLSDEYTTPALKAAAEQALEELPFSEGVGASYLLSENERSITVSESRYRLIHSEPQIGNRARFEWVERFIPSITYSKEPPYNATGGGTSITSIEILYRGVFRPLIEVGPVYDAETGESPGTNGGGRDLKVVAVMAPGGAVASVRILNPGSGYLEPPTLTFNPSDDIPYTTNAEATATIDADPESPNYGTVIAVELTNPGNYLPAIEFVTNTTKGGTAAEATCTLDETGGIAEITLTNPGSYYPATAVYAYTGGVDDTGAVLFTHRGTETPRCYQWGGITPGAYDVADQATWPGSPEYTLSVPAEKGLIECNFKRVTYDDAGCS